MSHKDTLSHIGPEAIHGVDWHSIATKDIHTKSLSFDYGENMAKGDYLLEAGQIIAKQIHEVNQLVKRSLSGEFGIDTKISGTAGLAIDDSDYSPLTTSKPITLRLSYRGLWPIWWIGNAWVRAKLNDVNTHLNSILSGNPMSALESLRKLNEEATIDYLTDLPGYTTSGTVSPGKTYTRTQNVIKGKTHRGINFSNLVMSVSEQLNNQLYRSNPAHPLGYPIGIHLMFNGNFIKHRVEPFVSNGMGWDGYTYTNRYITHRNAILGPTINISINGRNYWYDTSNKRVYNLNTKYDESDIVYESIQHEFNTTLPSALFFNQAVEIHQSQDMEQVNGYVSKIITAAKDRNAIKSLPVSNQESFKLDVTLQSEAHTTAVIEFDDNGRMIDRNSYILQGDVKMPVTGSDIVRKDAHVALVDDYSKALTEGYNPLYNIFHIYDYLYYGPCPNLAKAYCLPENTEFLYVDFARRREKSILEMMRDFNERYGPNSGDALSEDSVIDMIEKFFVHYLKTLTKGPRNDAKSSLGTIAGLNKIGLGEITKWYNLVP